MRNRRTPDRSHRCRFYPFSASSGASKIEPVVPTSRTITGMGIVKVWVRRTIMGVAAIVFLCAGALAGIYGFSVQGMTHRYEVPEVRLTISSDPASIERGRHLVVAVGKCVDCHEQGL